MLITNFHPANTRGRLRAGRPSSAVSPHPIPARTRGTRSEARRASQAKRASVATGAALARRFAPSADVESTRSGCDARKHLRRFSGRLRPAVVASKCDPSASSAEKQTSCKGVSAPKGILGPTQRRAPKLLKHQERAPRRAGCSLRQTSRRSEGQTGMRANVSSRGLPVRAHDTPGLPRTTHETRFGELRAANALTARGYRARAAQPQALTRCACLLSYHVCLEEHETNALLRRKERHR